MESIRSKSAKKVLKMTKCGENKNLVKIGEKNTQKDKKAIGFVAPHRGHDSKVSRA